MKKIIVVLITISLILMSISMVSHAEENLGWVHFKVNIAEGVKIDDLTPIYITLSTDDEWFEIPAIIGQNDFTTKVQLPLNIEMDVVDKYVQGDSRMKYLIQSAPSLIITNTDHATLFEMTLLNGPGLIVDKTDNAPVEIPDEFTYGEPDVDITPTENDTTPGEEEMVEDSNQTLSFVKVFRYVLLACILAVLAFSGGLLVYIRIMRNRD